MQLKGPYDSKRHKNRIQRSGKLGCFMSDANRNVPTMWRWAHGDDTVGTLKFIHQVQWECHDKVKIQWVVLSCIVWHLSHLIKMSWKLQHQSFSSNNTGQSAGWPNADHYTLFFFSFFPSYFWVKNTIQLTVYVFDTSMTLEQYQDHQTWY